MFARALGVGGAVRTGELQRVLTAVPTPRMHVRHVHRQLQPPGAGLECDLRQLLRLNVLHRTEGAQRPPSSISTCPIRRTQMRRFLERRDFEFKVERRLSRLAFVARHR